MQSALHIYTNDWYHKQVKKSLKYSTTNLGKITSTLVKTATPKYPKGLKYCTSTHYAYELGHTGPTSITNSLNAYIVHLVVVFFGGRVKFVNNKKPSTILKSGIQLQVSSHLSVPGLLTLQEKDIILL